MASPETETEEILEPLLATFRARLEAGLVNRAVVAYLRGAAQMVEFGRTLGGKPVYFEGPPMRAAIAWANDHCAKLVKRLDEETKTRLARTVGDSIREKRGIPGLARTIRKEFDDMTKYRSRLIARTETAEALGEGSYGRLRALEVTGKQWVTVGDDRVSEVCRGNEAAGIIPMAGAFPSGHTRVPGHPNCRCVIAPAMLAREI